MKLEKLNINLEDELKKIIKIKTNEQLNQYSNLFYNKIKKDIIINEFKLFYLLAENLIVFF